MNMNRNANGMVIGLVVVLILGVLGYGGSLLMRPAPSGKMAPTPVVNKADIDRSGAADEGDRQMIMGSLNCTKTDACWNTTIGKTKDGDNPLYVFDLDLDGDGVITQSDVDLVK